MLKTNSESIFLDYANSCGLLQRITGQDSLALTFRGRTTIPPFSFHVNRSKIKFTSSGQFITSWGLLGSNPGQLNQPKGLTLDEDNNVYVADEFNNRIQKFDSDGNFITEFGQDRLNHPIDVAVDSQGRVYASDLDEILIQVPTL